MGIGFDVFCWHLKAKWSYYPCKYCLVCWKSPWLQELSAQVMCHYIPFLHYAREIVCWTGKVLLWWSFAIQVTRQIIPLLLLHVRSFVCLFFSVFLVLPLSTVGDVNSLPSLPPPPNHTDNTAPVTATSSTQALTSAEWKKLLPITMPSPETKRILKKKDQRFL